MDSVLQDKILLLHSLVGLSISSAVSANNNLVLNLPVEQVTSVKDKLRQWRILYENIIDGELLINLSSIDVNTVVFFEEINFRQGVEKCFDPTGAVVKNIALIIYKGSFFIYENVTGYTYINSEIVTADFLVENAVYYYRILDVLQNKEFADYVNLIDKEIILYSGTKGIKRIQIPDYLPRFDPSRSIKQDGNTLFSKLGSSDFKMYFKNQLFDFRTPETSTAVKEIVVSLGNIIREADNNLQLYLKNFSFDRLKNDLQREKEKYFSSLRDILGKNLSQIVTIPVSFAASVFATYRVNDNFILFIILTAFILYSIFSYYLQALYLKDVREIEGSFQKDFKTISAQSGLSENEIGTEKIKISRRIADIKNVITRFRYLLVFLCVVFVIFIFYQVCRAHT